MNIGPLPIPDYASESGFIDKPEFMEVLTRGLYQILARSLYSWHDRYTDLTGDGLLPVAEGITTIVAENLDYLDNTHIYKDDGTITGLLGI